MKKLCGCLFDLFVVLLITPSCCIAQITASENRIVFEIQKILEYPQVLEGWTNWTNLCFLPPSTSLNIVCSSDGHITELTIIGNNSSPSSHSLKPNQALSGTFSIDSLFTLITKLSNLKSLSLVSLGLWGPLPSKINRFLSLEVFNISSNFIQGEIPSSISSMKNLKSLVLADNLFNGSVPDLQGIASLQELNLSSNKLRSQIPLQLIHFNNNLHILDISSNQIFGNIPSSLFSLPSLQHLNLASNQLSGNLSDKIACGSALTYVDISHNLLVGKLPSCVASLVSSKGGTVLYSWNCLSSGKRLSGQQQQQQQQHAYSYCNKEVALAVKPTLPKKVKKESGGMTLGLVIGIIGGVVGIAALLALFIVFIIFRKSKAQRSDPPKIDRSMDHKFSAHATSLRPIDARRVPQTMRVGALGLPPYRIFTSEEIEDATNNFDPSNLIHEGSQGQQYKGWIRDGSVVLINCMKLKQKGLPHSIMQEVLPNLRHRHLVSVLGHCVITHQDAPPQTTSTTVFIVYEFISNVSLKDQLTDWKKRDMLKWPQRMAMSIGIARGVQFLHTGVAPAIYGNNLSIENILLDDSLNAKVSRYSIPFTSNQIGSTNKAEKEDIYELGVILLELITGRRIESSSELEELKDEVERGSSEAQSVLRSAIDPSLRGTYAYESMRTAVQITINCLSKFYTNRPSIEDVLWNLHYSMQVQESWTSSGNLSTKF
ncbi:PREDICTED: probable LRR receptor-like serine/threonine-protein kinase At1g14390 [Lupinus angustifolius]|uniref:probable LRR receptor-like serine/threonine-protein kinase At1g14390 n=1 Tax=Lupinus angustifolius TaxID=3871 RepID=UPI00092E32A9|nr:PREDICTED: probable LRR receptor-like serine/threonine-protein kinase At1g14390 [Lupinus angustifolius]XP_019423326.1 PREDICTED: probable LRR receptor-like serine/threonine-protein kinase At1g14390 [Lupinus angustifolius]XP_019423327.1 PREDICTED: probable LRR receptor-like serine/threonine-protein kinase At1g14390 [Lupinus angustifolius]